MYRSELVSRETPPPAVHSTALQPAFSFAGEFVDQTTALDISTTPLVDIDVVGELLKVKRSANTRKAYEGDLRAFFSFACHADTSTPAAFQAEVAKFLGGTKGRITRLINGYKAHCLANNLAEATVNRRLAAIRALLAFAYKLDICVVDGRGLVDGEKSRSYRDTRGVDLETIKRLLKAPQKLHGKGTVRTLRDTALLRLLWDNALRRAEVCKLNVGDFSYANNSLMILGKGRGSEKERISLNPQTSAAIAAYLLKAGHDGDKGPLFRNHDHRPDKQDERLSPNGLFWLIKFHYGPAIGLDNLTPHKLRHSSITAALDATGGDVRKVQKLSRHAKLETLMIYDDNRSDQQGQVSNLLAGLLK